MRLWQKMCICSLSFFLLAFWIAGILMIENNKNTAFEQALRQSADEQTGISSGLRMGYAEEGETSQDPGHCLSRTLASLPRVLLIRGFVLFGVTRS